MDLTWLQIGGALRTQLYLYHCYWISQRKPPEGLRKFYLIESYLKFIRLQGFPKLVSAGSVCKTHRTARAQLWGWKLTSWKHSDAESLKCILITNNQHRDSFFLAAYFSYPILKILGFHSSQRFSRPWRPHEMVFKIPNLLPSPTLPGILVLSSEKNLQAYCFHCVWLRPHCPKGTINKSDKEKTSVSSEASIYSVILHCN